MLHNFTNKHLIYTQAGGTGSRFLCTTAKDIIKTTWQVSSEQYNEVFSIARVTSFI